MQPFAGLTRIDLRRDPGRDPADVQAHHARWRQRCGRSAGLSGEADAVARDVIEAVRERGDEAVSALTLEYEGRALAPGAFEVPRAQWAAARATVEPALLAALELATRRVRAFHATQRSTDTGLQSPGTRLASRVTPLRRVAVYAPGGTAAYPSSVIMAAVPAAVAGVEEIVLLTPQPSPIVLAAAELAGVHRVFAIGGAQAIAAAALGTASVPKVDKIVGPGNAFVTAAKRRVFGLVDVDGIAGPSEILVVADATAQPEIIAADLLAQAEHDRLACAVLVTDELGLADRVDAALTEQLGDLPRRDIAEAALTAHGAAVLVDDRRGLIEAADAYAAEHLELLVDDARAMADEVRGAGAIFVGPYTPEAAGDYTAGPSHVLPTAGAARWGSPVGVWDFVKHTSVLELDAAALGEQAQAIEMLARAEGLEAHARSVSARKLPEQGLPPDPDAPPWAASLRPSLDALSIYDVPPMDARARLHANECCEPWPPEIAEGLAAALRDVELGRYPDTSGRALRALLATRHGTDADRIVLGNGSDEVIALLLTALSGPPTRRPVLVIPVPTFVMYGHCARVLEYDVREVPLDERLRVDEDAMHGALSGASVCFLARPNNPTGGLIEAAVVERLVARHPEVVFVIDEAYVAYAPGASLWRPDLPDNVVHMATLSKVGMAALRVGYCIAHPKLARALNKVRHPYNLSATSLALATYVLQHAEAAQADMIARTIAGRTRLESMLTAVGFEVFPSAANFVLARGPHEGSAASLHAHLAASAIAIKNVSATAGLAGCVRITVGTAAELDLLETALADWSPPV